MYGEKTEQDHLEMMQHADRWPVWPLLPLRHRTRKDPDASGFNVLGFMIEDGITGHALPRVYVGLIYNVGKLDDMPFEDYPSLEAVVAAGWEVN